MELYSIKNSLTFLIYIYYRIILLNIYIYKMTILGGAILGGAILGGARQRLTKKDKAVLHKVLGKNVGHALMSSHATRARVHSHRPVTARQRMAQKTLGLSAKIYANKPNITRSQAYAIARRELHKI